jgi:hypothetical protein
MSDFGMIPAAPFPGTIRLFIDAEGHSLCMWTRAGQWEPLGGVRCAEIAVETGQPPVLTLTFDALEVDALAEPGRAVLRELVEGWPLQYGEDG